MRLVIVSNRVNLPKDRRAQAGGLAVAMHEVLTQAGGLWFGWSGEITEQAAPPKIIENNKITYATIDLSRVEHHEYYVGFANSILWPLLHYRMEFIDYRKRAFEGYLNVNRYFAKNLQPLLRTDDIIWVHDFHLIPLATELRKLGVAGRIGFFLHTPFPPPEVLAVLPHYDEILQALCAYDLIGFQTDDNVRAFLNCITELMGGLSNNGNFSAFGVQSRAMAFPIGIDTKAFVQTARRAASMTEATRLRASMADRSLIIGVDRLDYSKGIPNRFAAIDSLLADYPEHRGRFTYLQITPHSRSDVAQYRTLRRELEAAAGRINSKYAEFDWTPIRYINRIFSRRTLAGFYRDARIGFVTPLRDGMNLVAKEYVAAQDGDNPGVLVLSRFAGAARELETALLVNPFYTDEITSALHQGLKMPLEERQRRWTPMMATLKQNDILNWRNNFLAALAEN